MEKQINEKSLGSQSFFYVIKLIKTTPSKVWNVF